MSFLNLFQGLENPNLNYCPRCENYFTSMACYCSGIITDDAITGFVHRQKIRRMVDRLDMAEFYFGGYGVR